MNSAIGLAREYLRTIENKEDGLVGMGEQVPPVYPFSLFVYLAAFFASPFLPPTQLEEIQSRLLDVGSAIATPLNSDRASETKINRVHFPEESVTKLEGWIDAMDEELPTLANFILPSGGLCASQLHVCR